jgi:hypothetical protein
VLALAALAVGGIVNALSRTGAPLCRPDGLLQGHGVWHVLTAVGAGLWLARWTKPVPHPDIAAPAVGISMAAETVVHEGAAAAEGERS